MSSIRYIWFALRRKKKGEEYLKGKQIWMENKSSFSCLCWKVDNMKSLSFVFRAYIKQSHNVFMQIVYPRDTWTAGINILIVSWVTKIPIGHNWVHPSQGRPGSSQQDCTNHTQLSSISTPGKRKISELFFKSWTEQHGPFWERPPPSFAGITHHFCRWDSTGRAHTRDPHTRSGDRLRPCTAPRHWLRSDTSHTEKPGKKTQASFNSFT